MLDRLHIRLEAHSDGADHHRAYEIRIGRDLLSGWMVTVRYARVGTAGRTLRFHASSEVEARRILRNRLSRRLSAPRRIGCAYRLREISAAEDVNLLPWLGMICTFVEDEDFGRRRAQAAQGRAAARRRACVLPAAPLLDLIGPRPEAEIVDLAAERRRRMLACIRNDLETARDGLLAVYAAAPEPSRVSDAASELILLCDRLLDALELMSGLA